MAITTAATLSPSTYIVQDLFTRNEISIISGSLAVGKTTLALQWYDDFMHGRSILGHQSYPAGACFITCNRRRAHIRKRMTELQIPIDLPHLSLLETVRRDDFGIESAYNIAHALVPTLRVLFLDGMQSLIRGKANDGRDMDDFTIGAQNFCHANDLTIIGTTLSAKAKEGAGYTDPLERTAGAMQLVANCDTRVLLERWTPKDLSDPHRKLSICTSNRPTRLLCGLFGETGIDFTVDAPEGDKTQSRLSQWLAMHRNPTFTTQDLIPILDDLNVSRRTLYRWLDDQCELGTVERVEKGTYRIVRDPDSVPPDPPKIN